MQITIVSTSQARDGLKAVLSRQGSNVLNRGRELEAEARQTKFELVKAEARRPLKNPPSPRCIAVPNLVAHGLVSPPSWVEVICVIPLEFHGV